MSGGRTRRLSRPSAADAADDARFEPSVGMAEEEGFEPSVPSPVQQFSRLPPSTARPLLRGFSLVDALREGLSGAAAAFGLPRERRAAPPLVGSAIAGPRCQPLGHSSVVSV